jgi:carboxypeptidase family protein
LRVVLALIVALALPLSGAQGPEGTAAVRGRVIDAQTGRPLRNVFVNLYPQSSSGSGQAEAPKRSAITDGAGGFEVPKLVAGEYAMSASGPGDYLNIEYGVARAGGPSRRLRVKDGAQLDVTLRAWRGAAIAGHVYDERGAPVIGAQIRLLEKDAEVHGWGTTDDRGAYEIVRLAPGEYTVGVVIWLSSRTLSSTPSRDAARSWPPPMIPYVMDRGLRTVLLVQGAPLPPATEDGRIQVYSTTFAGGAATKEAAAFVRLEAGDIRENVDITLPAIGGTRVSGIVTAAADVTGTVLRLIPEGAARVDGTNIDATVAADGRFVFVAVPPGKYTLTGYRRRPPLTEVTLSAGAASPAMDDYLEGDPDDMWAEMPMSIGDADVDNLVVMLAAGTPLTGRVIVEDPDESYRPGQAFIALIADPRNYLDDRQVRMQSDGSVSSRVRPGAYRILANVNQRNRPFKTAIVNGQEIGDGPLIVGNDPIRDVQFVFGNFDAVLQGSVTESDGTPSPDATVIAIPANRDTWFRLETSGRAKIARTRTGAYRLDNLAPGDYYVVALHDFLGFPSAQHAAELATIATRATVRTGEPVTVNLVARDRE